MLQAFHKAKDHPRAKKYTASDMGWLATDNDNKAINDFRKHLNTCVSAFGGLFEHFEIGRRA